MNWLPGQSAALAEPDPLACAAIILIAFVGAGIAHTIWLRSDLSTRFMMPLDGFRTFRGKRVLGDNKTVRGFMVMVPATGAAFLALGLLHGGLPPWLSQGMWSLSPVGYALLGLWAGFCFMLAELPNSFLKRRLGIPPGAAAPGLWPKLLFFLVDRLDSVLGALIGLSLVVPVPLVTWGYVLLMGAGIHWLFSGVLFLLQVKARPA